MGIMLEVDKDRNEKHTMHCDRCHIDFPESFDSERKAFLAAREAGWIRVEHPITYNDYMDICPDCN